MTQQQQSVDIAMGILQALKAQEKEDREDQTMKDFGDTQITWQGTQISLPDTPHKMNHDEAIKALEEHKEDQNTLVDVFEVIDAFPFDGAVAFLKALKQVYGWARAVPTPGFFGPTPPTMVTVETGVGESVQVPWGQFKVPNIENPIGFGVTFRDKTPCLVLKSQVKKAEQELLKTLAQITRDILKQESIYRGKAIHLVQNEEGDLDLEEAPRFLDVSKIKPEEVILPQATALQIETNLHAPIKNLEACRKHKIPLNRGILLEGKYGTGKTMSAMAAAKICEDNGWTFVLVDRAQSLKEALLFAQRYQPAVVFAEDVDRIAGDRENEKSNDLLNTIDGALSKGAEVLTVMTTNHLEKIHPAMLRPGRLDAIIEVETPDAEAAGRLIRLYARDLLDPEVELPESLLKMLEGNIAATIREVVERAKLGAVMNARENIIPDDLIVAAKSMSYHLQNLNKDVDDKGTPEHQLGAAFVALVQKSSGGGGEVEDVIRDTARETQRKVVRIQSQQQEHSETMERAAKGQGKKIDDIHDEVCS